MEKRGGKNFRRFKRIDYKKKKLENPFFNKNRGAVRTAKPVLSFKFKLILALILGGVLLLVWLFFYSNVFKIKDIVIVGATRTPASDIKNIVYSQTNERRDLFFFQSNIFIFNEKELSNYLQEKYNFSEIKIEKQYAQKILVVSLTERSYSVIWSEAGNYYYLDPAGVIITQVSPLDITQNPYPIIKNEGDARLNGKNVNISPGLISHIIYLFDKFKNNTYNINIESFILDNDLNTIKMKVLGGPQIYFNDLTNLDEQLTKLQAARNDKLNSNFDSLEYVDLRFSDKVYYR